MARRAFSARGSPDDAEGWTGRGRKPRSRGVATAMPRKLLRFEPQRGSPAGKTRGRFSCRRVLVLSFYAESAFAVPAKNFLAHSLFRSRALFEREHFR
jgi:hypothetical protein